jgi:hypothetical protein
MIRVELQRVKEANRSQEHLMVGGRRLEGRVEKVPDLPLE